MVGGGGGEAGYHIKKQFKGGCRVATAAGPKSKIKSVKNPKRAKARAVPREAPIKNSLSQCAKDSGCWALPRLHTRRTTNSSLYSHTHTHIHTQVFGPLSMLKFIIHVEHKQNAATSISEHKKPTEKQDGVVPDLERAGSAGCVCVCGGRGSWGRV